MILAGSSMTGRLLKLRGEGGSPAGRDTSKSAMRPLFGTASPMLLYGPPGQAVAEVPPRPSGGQWPINRSYIAGLTNAGTNYVFEMGANCVGVRARSPIDWQVRYCADSSLFSVPAMGRTADVKCDGKHTYVPKVPPGWVSNADCEGCAILVVTRHPAWWARSQRREGYNCRRLPSPRLPLPRPAATLMSQPVSCVYAGIRRSENGTACHSPFSHLCHSARGHSTFSSLAELWGRWHDAYLQPSAHARIFVRYEDLLLRPHRCACSTDGDDHAPALPPPRFHCTLLPSLTR